MAKIRFETGQVINFDGDPTPEDIEEVAKSLQLSSQKTQESKPTAEYQNFWGKTFNVPDTDSAMSE